MRVDVMSTTITLRLEARPVRGVPSSDGSAVMSVPVPSGRMELRMRTGMLRSTAGRIVLGGNTLGAREREGVCDERGGACGAHGVEDAPRNVAFDGREDRARVQHLGAEVRELR